jgi:hypothetical protein
MLHDLFGGLFSHISAAKADAWPDATATTGSCQLDLSDTVEHVVDRVSKRLRAIPGYAHKLVGPITTTFHHIDQLAEAVPGPLLCARAAFSEQPLVNAFFVNPRHLQEVFSRSQDVRGLFDADPRVSECWGLLCVRIQERRQFGTALVNGDLRKDVMQTTVSFTDHQVVSPGTDEASARCALKCCMFNGLLAHIRHAFVDARTRVAEIEHRLRSRRRQLHDSLVRSQDKHAVNDFETEIAALESELAHTDLRLPTINDEFDYVAHTLNNPGAYIASRNLMLRVNRLGIKLSAESAESGFNLHLVEIRIASQPPRIGTLVCFPRSELLPKPDVLKQADLFLAL